MASVKSWVMAPLFALALCSTARGQAREVEADPSVWGVYARLVGTGWHGKFGTRTTRWGQGGQIIEADSTFGQSVITPGPTPGTLSLELGSSTLHTFQGTIASDGSVLWIRDGMIKMPYRVLLRDGELVEEAVKLNGREVASVKREMRYQQVDGPRLASRSTPDPIAEPTSAAPAAGVSTANADAAVSTAVVTATAASAPKDPANAGSAAAQSLEESYAKLCSKPADAKTEACQVLAKSLVAKLQGQQSVPASAQAANTAVIRETVPELVGLQRWGFFADLVGQELIDIEYENPGNMLFTPASVTYVWDVPGEVMGVFSRQGNGVPQRGATLHWDPVHHGLRETTPTGEAGALLKWQPDGSTLTTHGKVRMSFRRLPEGMIEILMEGDQGQGWQLMNKRHRVKATPSNLEAQALMRQIAANMAETNKLMAQIKKADAEHKSSALWQQTLIAQANAKAERERKREARANGGQMFGAIMQGLAQGMAEVNTGGYAEAQANLDATVANIQYAAAVERQQQSSSQQARQQPAGASQPQPVAMAANTASPSPYSAGQTTASPRAQPAPSTPVQRDTGAVPGKQLRFVLMISMRNLPGDKVNPTCYSNVVTRDGPPGWGGPGFLPTGSAEAARQSVESLKAQFIAACQASGRQITSAGNFNWVWNQMLGDEQKFASARAKYSEDVSVNVQ